MHRIKKCIKFHYIKNAIKCIKTLKLYRNKYTYKCIVLKVHKISSYQKYIIVYRTIIV